MLHKKSGQFQKQLGVRVDELEKENVLFKQIRKGVDTSQGGSLSNESLCQELMIKEEELRGCLCACVQMCCCDVLLG